MSQKEPAISSVGADETKYWVQNWGWFQTGQNEILSKSKHYILYIYLYAIILFVLHLNIAEAAT